MRSAPTLKICITPFASVAILEKLALLKIALCKAPVFSKVSWRRTSVMPSAEPSAGLRLRTTRSRIFSNMIGLRENHKMVWKQVLQTTSTSRGLRSWLLTPQQLYNHGLPYWEKLPTQLCSSCTLINADAGESIKCANES